jgi:hypothetical protein
MYRKVLKEDDMNAQVAPARIGQWYLHQDKGEMFRVTAIDEPSRTIEIQTFDGDVDEIDAEAWSAMPLELAEEPEDWTGPVDDVEVDDLGYSDTEMRAADWSEPLQPFQPQQEAWQDTTPEEEQDVEGEGTMAEELTPDSQAPANRGGR